MKKNFHIEQAVEVVVSGRFFDLHNRYDFERLRILHDPSAVLLSFLPNSEWGGGCEPLVLEFYGVRFFEALLEFGQPVGFFLDEIGYVEPDRRDLGWLSDEGQASEEDHLLVRLGAESFVRIHSVTATARIGRLDPLIDVSR